MFHRRLLQCLAAVLVIVLNGCYLPDQFKSELRMSKNGDYIFTYEGQLVWVPLYADIAKSMTDPPTGPTLSPEELEKRTASVYRDLSKDALDVVKAAKDKTKPSAGFTEVKDLGQGRFFVRYERRDRLEPLELATFLRRNNIIFAIRGIEMEGQTGSDRFAIEVKGALLKPAEQQQVVKLGMSMKGEFRVTTDADLAPRNDGYRSENASFIQRFAPDSPYITYIWIIDGPFSRSPYIRLQRDCSQKGRCEVKKRP